MVLQCYSTTKLLDHGYRMPWSCYRTSTFCHSLPTQPTYWKVFWKCKRCLYFENLQSWATSSGDEFGVRKDIWEMVGGKKREPIVQRYKTPTYIASTTLSEWSHAWKWDWNGKRPGWVNQYLQHSSLFCFLPSPPKNTRWKRSTFHA